MANLTNAAIAQALDELGDLYELDGADSYRVIAYRNAARSIRDAAVSVAEMVEAGKATELVGVGKTLDTKLRALVADGDIPKSLELRAKFPTGLIQVMHLPGFGPKRARRLYDELGIDSLESLRAAAEAGKIRGLRGFGARVEETLLQILEAGYDGTPQPRILLNRALGLAEQIAGALGQVPGAHRVEIAGSARRLTDSVKDIDLIATADDPAALAQALAELPLIESAGQPGENAVRATTHTGMKVDLQVVEPGQYGNVLQHLTGSKAHNVQLREAAVRKGLHVSQYGILDDATGETIRCATEQQVYATLGYHWIPPELREGRGELEAAALDGGAGLPELVTVEDLKGDLHCHTTASDGRNSAEQMARAAMARGLEYLAITDHSASHGFGNAVSADQLLANAEMVRELNASLDGFELLIGTEANILPDGSIDYPDEVLEQLDWVIASVHTSFGMSEREMTARMVHAMEHPLVDAIGHATGRKIETRPPYALSVDRLIEAAVRTHTMLEINSAADRRDLNDVYARAASEAGVPILIDSDAHGVNTLGIVRWGVATARRAWLGPDQVANTRSWAAFSTLRKRVRT
ncbi:MAG: polymerase [Solirubrobacteraceae bacterium]|nr:polymerase [Solirubrobacteraceae bacterium]